MQNKKISFFTIPKPFKGKNAFIQRNAIQSWLSLNCFREVYLVGDDEGIKETAEEFGIYHIEEIKKNEYGTPLISSAFDIMINKISKGILCYINTDIILIDNFVDSIEKVAFPSFLILGRRWNLDIKEPIDFHDEKWKNKLLNMIKNKGTLHIPQGMDYFIFPRNCSIKLPQFTVGRPGWDNWFAYTMWRKGIPIVDATRSITAVHQNHDYDHVPHREGYKYKGPEAKMNKSLIGDKAAKDFSSLDSTHILTPKGVKRAFTLNHLHYKWKRIPRLYPNLKCFHTPINLILSKIFKNNGLDYPAKKPHVR